MLKQSTLFLILGATATPAWCKSYPDEMEFSSFRPCLGNASFCRPHLLASGSLDAGAPSRLAAILAVEGHPQTIVFDSPGGSLIAGIELGQLIRRSALNTIVGTDYSEERYNDTTYQPEIVPIATEVGCYSACAYAFMGGVSRMLVEGAQIGVHQFNDMEAGAAESTAQLAVAMISQYMQAMGVNRDLLDVASVTGSDDMLVVPYSYAQRYNLDNQAPALSEWELQALPGGDIALAVDQQKRGSDGRTVIAFLTPEAVGYISVLIFQKGLRTTSELAMAESMEGEQTRPTICSQAGRCVELTAVDGWEYDRKALTLTAVFRAPIATVAPIASSSSRISFDAGFPHMFFNEAPSVDVGVEGLKNGFLALLR